MEYVNIGIMTSQSGYSNDVAVKWTTPDDEIYQCLLKFFYCGKQVNGDTSPLVRIVTISIKRHACITAKNYNTHTNAASHEI